jgi:hypothetical protein
VVEKIGEEQYRIDMVGDGVFGYLSISSWPMSDARGSMFFEARNQGADTIGSDDENGHGFLLLRL